MKNQDAQPPKSPPPLPTTAHPPPPLPGAEASVVQEVDRLSAQGVQLTQTQRTEEAEALLRRALALAEEKLSPGHASTAVCLNNLGEFLSQNGRFAEAETVLRRSVQFEEAAYGVDHVNTATALNNLALLLRRMERYAEAEPLYRRVLAIFETAHGPDSVNVAGVLNNLAQVLSHTGHPGAAEPLLRRVIGLFEHHFGKDHPNVAIVLNNLAKLLAGTGRALEAEPYSRRHLQIFQTFENTTGNAHAYKASAINGYGGLLADLGLTEDEIRARIDAVLKGRELADLSAAPGDPGAAPDFDQLSRAAASPDASRDDKYLLYASVFRLKEWLFVARGELPDVHPYLAANAGIADGAPMVKAFTDAARLHAFAKECGFTGPDGDAQVLSLPVASILPTMASYASQGVTHIHFNADRGSDGFYAPLVQLPKIRDYLENAGLLRETS